MRITHLRALLTAIIILISTMSAVFAQGSLQNETVDPGSNSAGAEVTYTFTFTTSATGNGTVIGIPQNGKIEFIFPIGFDISGVEIVQSKNYNLNGGFSTIDIINKKPENEDTVRVARDGLGSNVPGSTIVSIAIGMVINHTVVGNYDLELITRTQANNIIDKGAVYGFPIVAGPFHHFQVVTTGNAIAGTNFPITITAQDAHNNQITSFNNTATLTDKTGTINPKITGTFTNGVWTGNLTFTKSYTNNQVTVTYDNKSGMSALFNVLPGNLDHFDFDTISSPKTAGTSFNIKITAHDQYDNPVTSFSDRVTLTDNSGSLNISSNNFNAGVLANQSVTITKSQSANFITAVHSSGKSGSSNYFNVNSAALAKFYINSIASPRSAGEWFSITVVAQDNYSNTVTNFNGTVNISDLSNSISPTTSTNFSDGQWTGSVKISSSYTNDAINVKRTGGTEQGASNSFNVTIGSLDHFTISNIAQKTAGVAFSITITAKDKEGNTITSFAGPVSISDLSNTIQPQTSGTFTNGARTETVTVTGAKQNNQIIVAGNGKNGTSNYFEVNHNSLDHFTFLNIITSPQTAGQSFSVTIEARDLYENKVTNFNSLANLSDKTNTLIPTTTGNFSSGSWTGSVTLYKKATDNPITVAASGKSGQSNNFNIKSGIVHHIIVRSNPGGLGNEVGNLTLNLTDQVILSAAGYDQWDNYVRDIKADWGRTGTLDLPSPLNGTSTIFRPTTPQTSGLIFADSSGRRDYTGTITVGNIHHILIRDAADGDGNIVNSRTITADDTLKLYAAAYDEGNNYLGPAIVDWSRTGTLQPVISDTNMTMITFAPTKAPASGRIIATYSPTIKDTTGTITLNPGAPIGEIKLHPNPKIIPAHPDSFSVVTSNLIYDRDGNLINSGELFTISTTLGKIILPVDQAPSIYGHQVKSNWSSQITFTIQADSIGGTAIIHANSVGKGSAIGDTSLIIASLQIVSINTDNEKVSRGQNKVPVRMAIKNKSSESVKIPAGGAGLIFFDSFRLNRSAEYALTRQDTFTVIPGAGGQNVLLFEVAVGANATTDVITIDGFINGVVTGKTVSDSSASQTDKWLVQTPPSLRIERVTAAAHGVIQGTDTTVIVTIRNNGDVSAVIDVDSLTFSAMNHFPNNVTYEYEQFPLLSNPDTIHGHSAGTFSYHVRIGTVATLDTIILNAKVIGHDVNSKITYSDFEADFVDGWRVKQATTVNIAKFSPSQVTVTSEQDRDWYLNMMVQNSGGVDLRLDSLSLKFSIGGIDISNQYQVFMPDTFLFNGKDTLFAGTQDTIKITVGKTGKTLGPITIEGTVYLDDLISGQVVKNAVSGVIVQSVAKLTIDYVRASQPEVTVSQAFPWQVIIALSNDGGSDLTVDSTQIKNFISFAGDTNFIFTTPTGFFNSQNFILKAGNTDSLFFKVDTTGNISGTRQITARVYCQEINSNRNLTAQKNTTVKVELPANIRILKTKSLAPNAPYVDTGQIYPMAVIVENLGQDGARDIMVSLRTDSASTILTPVARLPFVAGGESDTLKFNVQASSKWILTEIFKAHIDSALASNTPELDRIVITAAVDSIDTATVQRPARMKISTVIPSQDTVRALSRDEWQIKVTVQDSGAGFIQLNPPHANDISISVESAIQTDYTVIAPLTFKNSHNLVLSWWAVDTLTYRVTATGVMAGRGKIRVSLKGKYLNSNSTFEVSDSAVIYIRPAADVYLDITEPICPYINQYGIGQVNTNQQFKVRSKIRNTGGERVDQVIISLTAPGYATKYDTISYIPPSGNDWSYFNVTAKQKPIEQVNFLAKIKAATSHESGLPASIGLASDSIASVRIHDPARLKLLINKADSVFATGKLGSISAIVNNLGTAEVDSSGEVYIQMPPGYHVVVNSQMKSADTTSFKIGQQISWLVSPPLSISYHDTIIVAISKPPVDRNTDSFAVIEHTNLFDTLVVKTIPSMMTINSFKITAPAGAKDNTLSTLQDFWVQVEVSASENIDSIQAELDLPDDYGLGLGMDKVKYIINNQAGWKLKAAENFHNHPQAIKVTVRGKDGNEYFVARDSIKVVAQKRALLTIEKVEITSLNAADSTLSVGQEFDLRATVINMGQANVAGQGFLKISFGATGITATQNDTIKPFVPRIPVTWRLRAPEVETMSASIVVSLEVIPLDENRNEAADIYKSSYTKWLETQQAGRTIIDSLWITSPSGALNKVLSTYQTFTIEGDIGWYNCRGVPSVTLHLTGGFTTGEPNPKTPIGTGNRGRVSWIIRAPEEPIQKQPIWLTFSAQDTNSGTYISGKSDSLIVDVVNRAEIQLNAKIVSPKSAIDNIVSTGQKFVVGAFLLNSGEAKLSGNYSVTLRLPEGQGYSLLDYPTQTAAHDDTLFWTIEAPIYEREAKLIEVELLSAPKDENTSVAVVAEAIKVKNDKIQIQTEEKTVTISSFSPNNKNTNARGDTSVPMLGLEMICSGNANSNNILLSGVKIKLKDRSGNLIQSPSSAISRLSVVKYRERELVYGQVTNIPAVNPIEILFSQIDTLKPEIPNKIEFLIDIFANTEITDFQLAIDSTDALYLVDEGSGQIPKLKDLTGHTLSVLNFESEPSVIIAAEFNKAFGNYPNPFGNSSRPQTHFVYYLEQDTEVKIQIYTLIGEPVWSCSYTASDPQGKQGTHVADIVWDGRNSQGYRVLNGVYIARISTGYGRNAVTKIAVIK